MGNRRRAESIRRLCILRPIVHLDAFNDLPIAMVNRFGLRLGDDLLSIYALERKLGVGYQWKIHLSKPSSVSIGRATDQAYRACELFLNDAEMQTVEPPEFSPGRNCGHCVIAAAFLPDPETEGYPALPLPYKDQATFEREEIDGPRKIISGYSGNVFEGPLT